MSLIFSAINLPPAEPGWSHNWNALVPIIHGITFILTIILLINPANKILLLSVLIIEGTLCMFVKGFGMLSCMFLNIIIESLFALGWFKNRGYRKLVMIYVVYCILLLNVVYTSGWDIYCFTLGFSIFTLGASLFIYTLVKERLTYYLPQLTRINDILAGDSTMPEYGEQIKLTDYGFTERQRRCTACAIRDNMTYPKIAEDMGISLSIVKREMAIVCRQFAVKNRDELYLLFIQYKVDYGL